MKLLCRYVAEDEPRALMNRHEDACDDPKTCKGCLPCEDDHCVACGVQHLNEGQTCPRCVDATRKKLKLLYGLHKHLESHALHAGSDGRLEAARPIPGGDAAVLLGPGSMGGAVAWAEGYNELATANRLPTKDTTHKQDERDNEPMPPHLYVQSWEWVWRKQRNDPAAEPPTMLSSVYFLLKHLSWAAQHTDSFAAFVAEISAQVSRLEAVLHDGFRPETGSAPCFRCSGDLERKAGAPRLCKHAWAAKQIADWADDERFTLTELMRYLRRWAPLVEADWAKEHTSCEQGGRRDEYECTRCHWEYPPEHYWFALRTAIDAEKTRKTA